MSEKSRVEADKKGEKLTCDELEKCNKIWAQMMKDQ